MIVYNYFAEIEAMSENILYKPAYSGRFSKKGFHNKGYSYLYKNPVVKDYQEKLCYYFNLSNISNPPFPKKDEVVGMITYYMFCVNSWMEKDVTNMVKAAEDALFSTFDKEWDDSDVVFNMVSKISAEEFGIDPFISVNIVFLDRNLEIKDCVQTLLESSWMK